MGGATQADIDTLIDLITSTIAPQTWDTVGGPGSIEGSPTNLSLVVSQTQDVHEEIADLLDQLRRLQDLQVTIEVRFITLNDSFYERIGIDFDFEVDDNTAQINGQNSVTPDDTGPSMAFGLDPTGLPTIDYDYAFTQGSFGSAVPQFGGFDAATAANFGFAILSDIEVFFLLQAAQGDDRTNVLQAPKVTLFNGQTGFVSDTSQRPFVTSVIPVVGDFARMDKVNEKRKYLPGVDHKGLPDPSCDDKEPAKPEKSFLQRTGFQIRRPADMFLDATGLEEDTAPVDDAGRSDDGKPQKADANGHFSWPVWPSPVASAPKPSVF